MDNDDADRWVYQRDPAGSPTGWVALNRDANGRPFAWVCYEDGAETRLPDPGPDATASASVIDAQGGVIAQRCLRAIAQTREYGKVARVTVERAHARGSVLAAGTYTVRLPRDYDPSKVTGEDILCDDEIVVLKRVPVRDRELR